MKDKQLILEAATSYMTAKEEDIFWMNQLLTCEGSKIEYKSQFNGDCVIYNDRLEIAYEATDIPESEIFEDGHSAEVHGWKILSEDHYEWFIKEHASKGKAIDYLEFKESLT